MPTSNIVKQCKTYAKSVGQKPFNWNKFLAVGQKHTTAEWAKARSLAGKWTTCACGNQCAMIPRAAVNYGFSLKMTGEPLDYKLAKLGYTFNSHIGNYKIVEARITLVEIEKRSGEILAELRRK